MSVFNTLKLARNLRRERSPKIVYDNKAMDWEDIFKLHPVKNKDNINQFYNMEHCKQYLGNPDDAILVLRSGYTWDLMRKIFNNAPEDCATFYDITYKTMLNRKGIMDSSIHSWFKKSLSALYLSQENVSERLNYFNELKDEQKEDAIKLSFQYFGENAFHQYKKKNIHNIENMNEKLLLWYWEADSRQHNFLDRVIDEIKPFFDLEYIADKFKPKSLLKYQTEEINKKYIPLENIIVDSNRYICDEKNIVCLPPKDIKLCLSEIYSLLAIEHLIKELSIIEDVKINPSKYISSSNKGKTECKFIDEKIYTSLENIYDNWKIPSWGKESLKEYINKNKSTSEKALQPYWDKVEIYFSAVILNEDLGNKKESKKKLKV